MLPAEEGFSGTDRFKVVKRLGSGGMGVVYEAFDRDRRDIVALKTLKEFGPGALYRFKHEFRALAEIAHPNLVPLYELVAEGERWFLTMELVEHATDLFSYLRPTTTRLDESSNVPTQTHLPSPSDAPTSASLAPQTGAAPHREPPPQAPPAVARPGETGPPDFAQVRPVFRQLAEGVAALHAAGKLHRDLKPSNVLVTAQGRVVILDFGLIADLAAGPAAGDREAVPSAASGDPRTSPSTDQGLAGTVAFMSPEQAAGLPLTPASDWYAVGVMLFIVLTDRLPFSGRSRQILASKQSLDPPRPSGFVPGVPRDLDDLCWALLSRDPLARPTGPEVLAAFGGQAPPASAPGSAQTAAPAPFVGRSLHLRELRAAFETMLQGRSVVCHVSGRSGAGKSTLIGHFLGELGQSHDVMVLAGRCYEQESVPYKAIDSLVDALTHHLMGLPSEKVEALAPAHIEELARVFPVLNRVQAFVAHPRQAPAAPSLRDVRHHAFLALGELLASLARIRPLVLHIDDLQWGDADSAALITDLLKRARDVRILLVVAYRSEYLATSACLQALAVPKGADPGDYLERRLDVDALTAEETQALTQSLLGSDRPHGAAEVDWVARESGGRPFFVYELVEHLKSGATLGTQPDLDKVLWQRVARLPEASRRLLEVIAVAGKPVTLQDAQTAAHLPSLGAQVVPGLRAGRLVRTSGPGLQDEIEIFHDRIRESIIANLLPEILRRHHSGLAVSLELSGRADPETLAAHFDGAGEPGRASAYYEQAAAAAVRVLAFDRAETLLQRAAALAPTEADRIRIQERMIHFYTDMARFSDAYAVGRAAVRPFGIRLPARFVPPLFVIDFLKAQARLRGRTPAQLLELPTAKDERLETAVRLMNAVAKAAYQVRPELCIAVATKIVSLCLRHGNTKDCAIGYMVLGAIFQGGVLGKHRTGYEFGRLALALVDKHANEQQRAEVNFVVGYFGTSWLKPATEAEALWRVAYEAGLRTGDLFHTGCACAGTAMSYHMRGVPLDRVWSETEQLLDVLGRHRLREPMGVVVAIRQAIRNLRGETRDRRSLSDGRFDEDAFVKELAGYGSRHFAHFYFILKLQLLYLWGEHEAALPVAAQSAAYLKDSPGMLHGAEHHFYDALVLLALGRSRGRARGAARRFRKWAADCRANFLDKSQILEAELARSAGGLDAALALYAAAEESAAAHGHPHMQALACQLGARALASGGRPDEARLLRNRAVEAYRRWGATDYAAYVATLD
jgi:serine/threonine protein kinase/predicted ATPase